MSDIRNRSGERQLGAPVTPLSLPLISSDAAATDERAARPEGVAVVPAATAGADREAGRHIGALRIALLGERLLCSACLRLLLREFDDRIVTADAATAAESLRQGPVDVAVLPLFWPHDTGLSQVSRTIEELASVPLVVLTDRPEPAVLEHLATLGVRGVLTLDLEPPLLIAALRLVSAGGIYMPPCQSGAASKAQHGRLAGLAAGAKAAALSRVSRRELSVLALLRNSMSNREIARTLGIAEATVKIHMRNLLRKTGARNRVELALLAAQAAD